MWHGDADNTLIYSKTTNFPFSVLHSLRAEAGEGSAKGGGIFQCRVRKTTFHAHHLQLLQQTPRDAGACYRERRGMGRGSGNCNRGKISGRQFSKQAAFDWNEGRIGGTGGRILVIIRCPQLSPSINQHIAAAHTH